MKNKRVLKIAVIGGGSYLTQKLYFLNDFLIYL